ncbi:hypothetical protein SAMN05444169_6305 [Bradyrhizobium erythrophlei]|uniref:Uncharacterized protein n=1 Tax=Bradyrhizobium erythrophlei TaxID=1437360 RepID=A0A1M5R323_9BRAD|nr:hypothetical protein SAMN05444169_6305 [Bradyrhizobium erythrophlei]
MKIETWHRRQGPNARKPANALAVLDCVRELVATFLQSDTPEPAKAPVVTLIRPRPDLCA